jgi:hypothetical protein
MARVDPLEALPSQGLRGKVVYIFLHWIQSKRTGGGGGFR